MIVSRTEKSISEGTDPQSRKTSRCRAGSARRAVFGACVKNPWLRFVLLLDFAGDFEDEDDDENEEDGGSGYSLRRFCRAQSS